MKYLLLFFLAFSYFTIYGENPDSVLTKLQKKESLIKLGSNLFDVDSKTLSAVIFIERRENYNWEDRAMDNLLANLGLNSSVGFCQVKLKTAYWIEHQLNDTNSLYFPGKNYYKSLNISKTPKELLDKLLNDELNIKYAAAYMRIMLSRWERDGFPLDKKPDILGTLYSTGLFYRNGEERKPNNNPQSNKFGEMVLRSMSIFEKK